MGAYWRVGGLSNKYGKDVHLSDPYSLVFPCSFFFHGTLLFYSVFQKISYFYSFDCVLINNSCLLFHFLSSLFCHCLHSKSSSI